MVVLGRGSTNRTSSHEALSDLSRLQNARAQSLKVPQGFSEHPASNTLPLLHLTADRTPQHRSWLSTLFPFTDSLYLSVRSCANLGVSYPHRVSGSWSLLGERVIMFIFPPTMGVIAAHLKILVIGRKCKTEAQTPHNSILTSWSISLQCFILGCINTYRKIGVISRICCGLLFSTDTIFTHSPSISFSSKHDS